MNGSQQRVKLAREKDAQAIYAAAKEVLAKRGTSYRGSHNDSVLWLRRESHKSASESHTSAYGTCFEAGFWKIKSEFMFISAGGDSEAISDLQVRYKGHLVFEVADEDNLETFERGKWEQQLQKLYNPVGEVVRGNSDKHTNCQIT
jgi:hypothetical protein